MDFTSASNLLIQNITALGDEALVVFGAVILVAAGVFLIRWGFEKAKASLNGEIDYYEGYTESMMHKDNIRHEMRNMDSSTRGAYLRGRILNKREGIDI